jgi:hypothetical protein
LVKAIVTSCESLISAQAVAITLDNAAKSFVVMVNWTPEPTAKVRLDQFLDERSLEAITTNGRTVFRSR